MFTGFAALSVDTQKYLAARCSRCRERVYSIKNIGTYHSHQSKGVALTPHMFEC